MKKIKGIKLKSVKKKFIFILITLIILSIIILWYFDAYVNPVILTTTYSKVKTLTSQAINASVSEVLNGDNTYDKLIDITYDNDGKITSIQANAVQANLLAKEISRLSIAKIDEIGQAGIGIPLGSFTGMPIFMGRGPEVMIKTSPIGSLQCDYYYEFVSTGINQTAHRIYLYITSDVNLILPMYNNTVQTYTEVMLCESIIVGEVPQVYFNNNSLSSLLDLIP